MVNRGETPVQDVVEAAAVAARQQWWWWRAI